MKLSSTVTVKLGIVAVVSDPIVLHRHDHCRGLRPAAFRPARLAIRRSSATPAACVPASSSGRRAWRVGKIDERPPLIDGGQVSDPGGLQRSTARFRCTSRRRRRSVTSGPDRRPLPGLAAAATVKGPLERSSVPRWIHSDDPYATRTGPRRATSVGSSRCSKRCSRTRSTASPRRWSQCSKARAAPSTTSSIRPRS